MISSNSLNRSLQKIALCSSIVMGLSACGGDNSSDNEKRLLIKAQ